MNCWICGNSVVEFLDYGLPPRRGRCPHCGAKPRNRAAYWYLTQVVRPALGAGDEVLEIGSSRIGARYLCTEAAVGDARCTLIDERELDFHARIESPHRFLRMDVTDMTFADDCFDVILCNNTLPYVRDDRKALAEIFRCLKPDGLAMLDSSYDGERTLSVAEFRCEHPELGDDYFAENGDQWVYGKDYIERLQSVGFQVRIDEVFAGCTPEFKLGHGFKAHHELVVAFRSARGSARFTLPERGCDSIGSE